MTDTFGGESYHTGLWPKTKVDFTGKRVAVTGVSRNPQSHGSNVVYQRLRQRGYQVFGVDRKPWEGRPRGVSLTVTEGGYFIDATTGKFKRMWGAYGKPPVDMPPRSDDSSTSTTRSPPRAAVIADRN